METTTEGDNLRYTKIPLTNGSGAMPALGFGTLIPNLTDTKTLGRCSLGRYNAARLSLPPPKPPVASKRTLMSRRFLKTP
jgi:hypothetical protein